MQPFIGIILDLNQFSVIISIKIIFSKVIEEQANSCNCSPVFVTSTNSWRLPMELIVTLHILSLIVQVIQLSNCI